MYQHLKLLSEVRSHRRFLYVQRNVWRLVGIGGSGSPDATSVWVPWWLRQVTEVGLEAVQRFFEQQPESLERRKIIAVKDSQKKSSNYSPMFRGQTIPSEEYFIERQLRRAKTRDVHASTDGLVNQLILPFFPPRTTSIKESCPESTCLDAPSNLWSGGKGRSMDHLTHVPHVAFMSCVLTRLGPHPDWLVEISDPSPGSRGSWKTCWFWFVSFLNKYYN